MGLDMYLYRETATVPLSELKFDDFGRSNQIYEKKCVAYWRKANQVHAFFVNNVQDGEDNCSLSYVPDGTLQDLVAICEKICEAEGINAESFNLEDLPSDFWEKPMSEAGAKLAEENLPPCQGFFFGSYELNGGYLYDLIVTVQQLKPLIESLDLNVSDLFYQASW